MTRSDLLRELRECASLEDREIARQKALEAISEYATLHGPIWTYKKPPDDEITAAYRAATHRAESEEEDDREQ